MSISPARSDSGANKHFTCPSCSEEYDLNTHEPHVYGSCGHTVCRACISLVNKRCPVCQHESVTLCPNYSLCDVLEITRARAGTPPPSNLTLPVAPFHRKLEQHVERHAKMFQGFDITLNDRCIHEQFLAFRDFEALVDQAYDARTAELKLDPYEDATLMHSDQELQRIKAAAMKGLSFETYGTWLKEESAKMNLAKFTVLVYWDSENMEIPYDVDAMRWWDVVLKGLEAKNVGLASKSKIIGFYCPSKKRCVSSQHVDQMRLMMPILSACSSRKKEEVDRQLSENVKFLAGITQPDTTRVVVVSSDGDYVPLVREVSNMGFNVYVVHKADPGSRHETSLGMFAAQAFHLKDIIPAAHLPTLTASCGACNKLVCTCVIDQERQQALQQQKMRDSEIIANVERQRKLEEQRLAEEQHTRELIMRSIQRGGEPSEEAALVPTTTPAPVAVVAFPTPDPTPAPSSTLVVHSVLDQWIPHKGFGFFTFNGEKTYVHFMNFTHPMPRDTEFCGCRIVLTDPIVERNDIGFRIKRDHKCVAIVASSEISPPPRVIVHEWIPSRKIGYFNYLGQEIRFHISNFIPFVKESLQGVVVTLILESFQTEWIDRQKCVLRGCKCMNL